MSKIRRRQRCPKCGSLSIIRWGLRDGRQRYKCQDCGTSFVKHKDGVSRSNRLVWFRKWVLGKQTIEDIAHDSGYSARQLHRWFDEYLDTSPTWTINTSIPIDLNAFAKEILDKYAKEQFPDNRALPVISNQKMNKYLKDLGELCGFKDPIKRVCFRGGKRVEEIYPKYEMLGTHAGRRTFICFALSSGIPPQVVMKWTGHSDYSAMKPYIDIAEKTKANAMSLFEMELKK